MDTELDILTTKEAAGYLHISEYTLRQLCRGGFIPHARLGSNRYRFTKQALNKWIQKQEDRNWTK